MANPRTRFTSGAREVVSVDYADVLRQAVLNERYRLLRSVRESVERLDITRAGYSYREDDRTAKEYRKDVLAVIDKEATDG